MGEYLSQPIIDKDSSDGDNESVIYGACGMQGWRKKMEDTHLISLNIGNNKTFNLFGVFDGHGGDEVAKYVKAHFTEVLCSNQAFEDKKYEIALKESFLKMDELLRSDEAKKELFELSKNDKEVNENTNSIKKEEDRQLEIFKSLFDPRNLEDCNIAMFTGCTASVCLIVDNVVYLANAGDSKGVIFREGKDSIVTKVHSPDVKEEENRIINANGVIEDKRINGIIDLTRSIGDLEYKKDIRLKPNKQIIISEPDVIQVPIKEVDYIVLGCDGFWDFKVEDKTKKDDKNLNIESRVKNDIKTKNKEEKYSTIIEKIFDYILETDKDKKDKLDNKDNMTCIIIEIKEEAKIEKVIEEPKIEKAIEEAIPFKQTPEPKSTGNIMDDTSTVGNFIEGNEEIIGEKPVPEIKSEVKKEEPLELNEEQNKNEEIIQNKQERKPEEDAMPKNDNEIKMIEDEKEIKNKEEIPKTSEESEKIEEKLEKEINEVKLPSINESNSIPPNEQEKIIVNSDLNQEEPKKDESA